MYYKIGAISKRKDDGGAEKIIFEILIERNLHVNRIKADKN